MTTAPSEQIEAAAVPLGVALAVGSEPVTLGRCFLAASISGMLAPEGRYRNRQAAAAPNGGANGWLAKPRSEDPPRGLRADGGELPDKRGEAKR